jgi:hypothetical protein
VELKNIIVLGVMYNYKIKIKALKLAKIQLLKEMVVLFFYLFAPDLLHRAIQCSFTYGREAEQQSARKKSFCSAAVRQTVPSFSAFFVPERKKEGRAFSKSW